MCVCVWGWISCQREENIPATGTSPSVERCKLLGGAGQILPGVEVGEWGAGEGEPEIAQAAWNGWQI